MQDFANHRAAVATARRRALRPTLHGPEPLEGRALLTGSGATIVLVGSLIEVIGTDHGDNGSVSLQGNAYHVKLANSQGSDDVAFPAGQVSAVYYQGGRGANTFANATALTGYLIGGPGDNTLTGGSGVDYLMASGTGSDRLNAGPGTEYLTAYGSGTNVLTGGGGTDQMSVSAGANTINAGSGSDTVITFGGQNTVTGGTGATTLYSLDPADTVTPSSHVTVHQFY